MPIKDMIGQFDYNPTEKNKTLCAGFMLVNNTEASKDPFLTQIEFLQIYWI